MALFQAIPTTTKITYTTPQIIDIIMRLIECEGHESEVFTRYGYKIAWVSVIKQVAKQFEQLGIALVQAQPNMTHEGWVDTLWNALQTTQELTDEQKASFADLDKTTFTNLLNLVIHWNPTHDETRTFESFKNAMQPQ